ncbi:MAG: FkbM family methyltransferase [Pseudomonadales bacterium]|nr:FkbM family methyltransferase [Pseudomonadales bacterium]
MGTFIVPAAEIFFWIVGGPMRYYMDELGYFFATLQNWHEPFILIDAGADIGTVSMLTHYHCPNLARIIAIEPNPRAFRLLEQNLHELPIPVELVPAALGEEAGQASLSADPTRLNDHEGQIYLSADGETDVLAVDSLLTEPPANLAFKLDVEGMEVAVLRGASRTIRSAARVALLLEVHPDVLDCAGQTPEALFEAAESLRPMVWHVPLLGNRKVDRTTPFLSQLPRRQYDVIGLSVESL